MHSSPRDWLKLCELAATTLMKQLYGLFETGNTVIVVKHDMSVAAVSDWIIDIGPGTADEGGRIVAFGTLEKVAARMQSRTAGFLAKAITS